MSKVYTEDFPYINWRKSTPCANAVLSAWVTRIFRHYQKRISEYVRSISVSYADIVPVYVEEKPEDVLYRLREIRMKLERLRNKRGGF